MTDTRSTLLRIVTATLTLLLVAGIAHADLGSVRYRKEGNSHYYLSTHNAIPLQDREVALAVYVLDGRYVATYTETRRRSASESEVLAQRELTGAVAGMRLAGLGTMKQLGESKNGKPVFELSLEQAVGAAPAGLVARLAWTGGSWAPPSVR